MDFAKWCRICSVEVKCGVFLFGEEAKKTFLHTKIRRYLSIAITLHDQLPKMICEDCICKLDGFHKFATLALKNQEKMMNIVLTNSKVNQSSISLKTDNISLLHSYLTNGLSIKKEYSDQDDDDDEVTEVEVRIDPMAILQCCLDDEASSSEPDEDERSEECVTMEGIEDAEDNIFEDRQYDSCTDDLRVKRPKIDDISDKAQKRQHGKVFMNEIKAENGIEPNKSDAESIQGNSSDEDSENTRIIYLCSICNKNFDSETLLQHHVQLHKISHSKDLYNYAKANILKYKSNIPEFLPLPMLLPRLYGAEKFHDQLLAPKLSGSPDYLCPICAKTITSEENLKIHLETHRPKGQYACDICGRIFKTESNLDKHKEYHGGIQHKCDVCGRVYPTNSTLRAHSITHSDLRPHKCPLCDKTFKRNQDLKFHINQHTGARPYQCPYCPKAFASSGNCFSHRKRMHPLEVERDKERAAKIMR